MRYRFIKYARMRSLPDHEHERIEVSIELRDGDNPDVVFEEAKEFVDERLGLQKPKPRNGPSMGTIGDQLAAKGQSL